jgi:hypothetical protein
MPINVSVGRRSYESTNKKHAEEVMFADIRYATGNFTVDMDGWPCTGERGHNCHQLFKTKSVGRIITVNVSGDHAGYSRNHDRNFGATGTITYNNGVVTYS